jgi:hypothetical protein
MTIQLHSLLSAPILFFFLGTLAALIGSDLRIPKSLSKFLALYLLFSIGFKGGGGLVYDTWNREVWITLSIGILMAIITPLYLYFFLKKKLKVYDAGALAATYGSVSAVTFITASSYLEDLGISYGSHMLTLMALMETPAILIGIFLIRIHTQASNHSTYWKILQETLTSSSIIMLMGSLGIGFITNPQEAQALYPFTVGIFKGMLLFFLLDIGLEVGKNIKKLKAMKAYIILLGLLVPILNAAIGIGLSYYFKLGIGNSLLLVVLLASGSYIAVPATLRLAVPQANPALYLSASLGITFPFNLVIGIPIYYHLIKWLMHYY